MAKLTYAQQLMHPNWQRRRLHMLEQAAWQCTSCYAEEVTLHVHHRQYFKGRMAWEYSDDELAVLCKNCHDIEHHDDEQLKRMLVLVPMGMAPVSCAVAVLAGYFGHDVEAVEAMADEIGVYDRLRFVGDLAARLRSIPDAGLKDISEYIDAIAKERKRA